MIEDIIKRLWKSRRETEATGRLGWVYVEDEILQQLLAAASSNPNTHIGRLDAPAGRFGELVAALQKIADNYGHCQCDHTTPACCEKVGEFCPHCISELALASSPCRPQKEVFEQFPNPVNSEAVELLQSGIIAMTGRARIAWANKVRDWLASPRPASQPTKENKLKVGKE